MILWSLHYYTRGIKVENVVKISVQTTYPISGISSMENSGPSLGAVEEDDFTRIESQVGIYMVGLCLSVDHCDLVGSICTHIYDYYSKISAYLSKFQNVDLCLQR